MSCRRKRVAHPRGAIAMALLTCGGSGNSGKPRAATAATTTLEHDENDGCPETPAALKRLATTFDSDQSSYGFMVDLKTKSPIVVRSIDINTVKTAGDAAARLEIWTKVGSFRGYENSPEAWTLWANETIAGNGLDVPTTISPGVFPPLVVEAREKRALYVSSDGPHLRHSNESERHYYINRDLFFYSHGAAMGRFGFKGESISPRLFNGALHYEVIEPSTKNISTTFESSKTYAGSMFDIEARGHIKITSLAFNTYKTVTIPIKLYTKEGTHRGFDKDISSWTLVASLNVKGMGLGNPTYICEGAFEPILVLRGERRSFYVTSDGPYLRAALGTPSGEGNGISTYNSDMIIYEGVGKRHPIEEATFAPRAWNGVLRYQVVDITTSAPTTSQPTVRPTPDPTRRPTSSPTTRSFRLRLYWKPGYYWQESRREMWFCMECRGSCRSGDSVYVDTCQSRSVRQQFLAAGDTIRPVHDPSLCLTVTGYDEEKPIRVYRCGGSRGQHQRFDGFNMQERFELHPRGDSKRCVSQMHHPKKYERIYPESCKKTRDHDTTYWVVY